MVTESEDADKLMSAGSQKFPELLFDAAEDGVVEAPV